MNLSKATEYSIFAAQCWAAFLSVVGTVGNLLSIGTIAWQFHLWRKCNWRRPRSLSTNNLASQRPILPVDGYTILLLNLSICDLLYCSVNLPLTIYIYQYPFRPPGENQPSELFCTFAALFRYLNALVEWQTLALITIQRCVDLRRSRSMRFFKPKPTIAFIALAWILSSAPQFVILVKKFGGYGYIEDSLKCDILDDDSRKVFYSLESAVPCFLMPIGCFVIIFQIWSNIRKLRRNGVAESIVKDRKRDMLKSVTLILTLLFIFLVCVVPICVYNLLYNPDQHKITIGIIIYMVYWIQYALNVFLYVARNENFMKAFQQFVTFQGATLTKCLKGDSDRDVVDGESPCSNSAHSNSDRQESSVRSLPTGSSPAKSPGPLQKSPKHLGATMVTQVDKLRAASVDTSQSTIYSVFSHQSNATQSTDVSCSLSNT